MADPALDELWARLEAAGPLAEGDPPVDLDDGWLERASSQADRRRTFIAFFGWAVPSREVIQTIAGFVGERQLLEIGAGNGLWARLLAGAGVQIIATEPIQPREPYLPVEEIEAEAAVRAHRECPALLVCWPPFRNDCAYRALRAFRGEQLIFVGDPRFTAERQFHQQLAGGLWMLKEVVALPSWPGLEDKAYLYRRRVPQASIENPSR